MMGTTYDGKHSLLSGVGEGPFRWCHHLHSVGRILTGGMQCACVYMYVWVCECVSVWMGVCVHARLRVVYTVSTTSDVCGVHA